MQMTAILALFKNSDNSSFLNYQRAITYFSTWCVDNFLHLNISKTKELVFSSSKTQIHPSIDINGEMVERVEHFRYLGITLDDHLKFNQHNLDDQKIRQSNNNKTGCFMFHNGFTLHIAIIMFLFTNHEKQNKTKQNKKTDLGFTLFRNC